MNTTDINGHFPIHIKNVCDNPETIYTVVANDIEGTKTWFRELRSVVHSHGKGVFRSI